MPMTMLRLCYNEHVRSCPNFVESCRIIVRICWVEKMPGEAGNQAMLNSASFQENTKVIFLVFFQKTLGDIFSIYHVDNVGIWCHM